MKILTEKPSQLKLFIEDFVIPMAPFVILGIIGIITNHFMPWIARLL